MMPQHGPRQFPADLNNLPQALAFVAEACRLAGVSTAISLNAELVIEELFTNTVQYGVRPTNASVTRKQGGLNHSDNSAELNTDSRERTQIRIHVDAGTTPTPAPPPASTTTTCPAETNLTEFVRLAYHDSGPAFNPLIGLNLPSNRPIKNKTLGGLGRILVVGLATRSAYRREDGINVLEIELTGTAPSVGHLKV
jgi:hypothetical protein